MKVETIKTNKGLTRYVLVDDSGEPVQSVLKFIRFKDNCGRARNTLKNYCFHLKSYFEFLEGSGFRFDTVGIDEVAAYMRWLQGFTESGKIIFLQQQTQKRCNKTVNVYMSTVYEFYDYLRRHEDYGIRLSECLTKVMAVSQRGFKDFLYHINRTKKFDAHILKLKAPKSKVKVLEKSQVESILQGCLTLRDRFLIQLLWESGIRISEALALWLEDIEPDAQKIHIKDRGELVNLAEIKTVCSPRSIDVSVNLINLFFEYITEAHTDDVDINHILIKLSGNNRGQPMEYGDVSALVVRIKRRTGISFTSHMLRHTSFTKLRQTGWSVEQLQKRAGHAQVQSTYIYLHPDDDELLIEWKKSEEQMKLQERTKKE